LCLVVAVRDLAAGILRDLAVNVDTCFEVRAAVPTLVKVLSLPSSSAALLEHAVAALQHLARSGSNIQDMIADEGAISPLVTLLRYTNPFDEKAQNSGDYAWRLHQDMSL
jgi:hypothetical protein